MTEIETSLSPAPENNEQTGIEDLIKINNAKAYLVQSALSDSSVYDHLSKLITKVLEKEPISLDALENHSRLLKKEQYHQTKDCILNKAEKTKEFELGQIQSQLYTACLLAPKPAPPPTFRQVDPELDEPKLETVETPLPDLLELLGYFEQAGSGISREEGFRIWLAMKTLVETNKLSSIRFWGKLFGTQSNYIVVEAEEMHPDLPNDVIDADHEITELNDIGNEELEGGEEGEHPDVDEIPPEPVSKYEPPAEVPTEQNGTGVNKKTYFVCTDPGMQWEKLPDVSPKQIQVSRQIKKFLTGNLNASIISFPPFPGNEANYLRAQIARISAATHISPKGFYDFSEEEEDEPEDGKVRDTFQEAQDFEDKPLSEMLSTESWAHHVMALLKQGGTVWWNPVKRSEGEGEEEEEEAEDEADLPQQEMGPALLTAIAEDDPIGIDGEPWTTKISTSFIPQHAIAIVRSNLWPGAVAFCRGRTWENIYIGWGHKYAMDSMTPMQLPVFKEEFPSDPLITEKVDPTPEEEAAYLETLEAAKEGEEEGEGEGDEDEDDD